MRRSCSDENQDAGAHYHAALDGVNVCTGAACTAARYQQHSNPVRV